MIPKILIGIPVCDHGIHTIFRTWLERQDVRGQSAQPYDQGFLHSSGFQSFSLYLDSLWIKAFLFHNQCVVRYTSPDHDAVYPGFKVKPV